MSEKLSDYRKKRDFTITKEPRGEPSRAASGRTGRFSVQYHIARRVHYDVRLEWNGVLLSWAVPKGPSFDPRDKRLAVKVEDHPIEYADFEGTIPSDSYGGGTVMLWDEGLYEPLGDFDRGLKDGSLKFTLFGGRLRGKWALIRLRDERGSDKNWLLIKESDEYAMSGDGIANFTTGINSGRTAAEIAADEDLTARKNPFDGAEAQLAQTANALPEGEDWLYEVKYDGYRIIAFVERGKTRLMTRNGRNYAAKFATVAAALSEWAKGRAMVLDGEAVVTDAQGRTSFQDLQGYLKTSGKGALAYIVFDLLALDGRDLRGLPLIERKERLERLLDSAPSIIRYSKHVIGKGGQCFAAAQKLGLEGVVGKRASSPYRGDRGGDWIKMKCYNRQEFVIGGYALPSDKPSGIRSLLLGLNGPDGLVYSGRAGTGLGRREKEELENRFDAIKSERCPFSVVPKAKGGEKLVWLKPRLVAEIQFAEFTAENLLRQASFKGLRDDKLPSEAIKEGHPYGSAPPPRHSGTADKGVAVCGIKISNPDKIVYLEPRITKLDVVRYYESVARRMLLYAGGRVLSVVRCHKGVTGECFFKKHPAGAAEGAKVVKVTDSDGQTSDYFCVENRAGLVSEAQLGTLEFHVWGSRAESLERPDMMVFDLDPDAGMDLELVRRGVRDLKSVLDELSLTAFLKTSGGKGYHIVVPFDPTADWNAFRGFARSVAGLMQERWPERYTDNIRKDRRKGKIFVDWERNGRGATSVAPYSLRARPGARVSLPIAWSELDTLAPGGADMGAALESLRGPDPWLGFFTAGQKLKKP